MSQRRASHHWSLNFSGTVRVARISNTEVEFLIRYANDRFRLLFTVPLTIGGPTMGTHGFSHWRQMLHNQCVTLACIP